MEDASKMKASKVWDRHRTADMEKVAEQARTERAGYSAQNAQLESGLHQLKGKLDSSSVVRALLIRGILRQIMKVTL